jgi:hypothetical protein
MTSVKLTGRPETDAFQVHQIMSGGHLMDMYAETKGLDKEFRSR